MADVVTAYLNAIIPSELIPSKSQAELLSILLKDQVGERMLSYVQKLRLANERRCKFGSQCKVYINWTPTSQPQALSCQWDKIIMGNIPNSLFGRYLNLYTNYLVRRKSFYSKYSRGLSARP